MYPPLLCHEIECLQGTLNAVFAQCKSRCGPNFVRENFEGKIMCEDLLCIFPPLLRVSESLFARVTPVCHRDLLMTFHQPLTSSHYRPLVPLWFSNTPQQSHRAVGKTHLGGGIWAFSSFWVHSCTFLGREEDFDLESFHRTIWILCNPPPLPFPAQFFHKNFSEHFFLLALILALPGIWSPG